ncbi:MAG: hypothetical protein Tsb009_30160 [Planctomycetaceae bacterium]
MNIQGHTGGNVRQLEIVHQVFIETDVMILAVTGSIYLLAAAANPPVTVEQDFKDNPFARSSEVIRFSFEREEDRDFDGAPDNWTRRKGLDFPVYVKSEITRKISQHGKQSLEFDVNGGRAIYYSAPVRIDSLHAYVLEGYVRTQRLKHDAALISVSFLNHKRQRVQRFLTQPVSGTHKGWVRLRLGPMPPRDDVRFVVVGCHLTHGTMMDIHGKVWFDNIRLGRLPRLSLVTNFQTHFKIPQAPVIITANVGGLDTKSQYRLRLELFDSQRNVVAETLKPLIPKDSITDFESGNQTQKPHKISWKLPPAGHGFYSVRAALERDGKVILAKHTTFAVMDLIDETREGEFGWSVARGTQQIPLKELADIAAQSGINWLKYPLWQSVFNQQPNPPAEIVEFLGLLVRRRITPVGLLNTPPPELRNKFGRKWSGVSEVFTMPEKFWWPYAEPVIARYSSSIRHWHLGDGADTSFVGLSRLSETLHRAKTQFDTIGRDTRIGVHWDWKTPLPTRKELPYSFLTINGKKPLSVKELRAVLKKNRASGLPLWVLLRPLSKSKYSSEERGRDLVKRMVAAKVEGAQAIIASDVFDSEHGLLNKNGSPSLVYLPWRTTALALQGTEYLGSIDMPNGSENHIFVRDGEAVFVLWSKTPKTEELYLGENVENVSIWGERRRVPIKPGTNRHVLQVGPSPIIIRGCSEPIARWRMETKFQIDQLQSRHGGQLEAILSRNTFPQGVSGTVSVTVPKGWEIKPKLFPPFRAASGEQIQHNMRISIPTNASLGDVKIRINYEISSDRKYSFQVYRTIKVGLGDVGMRVFDRKLKDGRLEIEQIITNNISPETTLNFRCSLFIPRTQRQRRLVTKLKRGKDRRFYYLPNAEAYRGKTLWLRAEQINGNRVLNFRWKALGEVTRRKKKKAPTQPKSSPKIKQPKTASIKSSRRSIPR